MYSTSAVFLVRLFSTVYTPYNINVQVCMYTVQYSNVCTVNMRVRESITVQYMYYLSLEDSNSVSTVLYRYSTMYSNCKCRLYQIYNGYSKEREERGRRARRRAEVPLSGCDCDWRGISSCRAQLVVRVKMWVKEISCTSRIQKSSVMYMYITLVSKSQFVCK